jgi:hypothetical protein
MKGTKSSSLLSSDLSCSPVKNAIVFSRCSMKQSTSLVRNKEYYIERDKIKDYISDMVYNTDSPLAA